MRSIKVQPSNRGASIKRLNPQQQIFVNALLADSSFNARAAAKVAGYKNVSAASTSLLDNPVVCAIIGKEMTRRKDELRIDASRVLKELADIGFADPGDLFDDDCNLLPIKKMKESVRRAISSFDVEVQTRTDKETGESTTTTSIKPKFWNKLGALELIAKHLGMLEERFKVDHNVGIDGELIQILLGRITGERNGTGDNVVDAKFIESKVKE